MVVLPRHCWPRRSATLLTLALLAVALLAVGGCASDQSSDPEVLVPAHEPEDPSATGSAAAAQLRYVGSGRMVVAVPRSWQTTWRVCSQPEGDIVQLLSEDAALLDCAASPTRGVSSVVIAPLDTGLVTRRHRPGTERRIGPLSVWATPVSCPTEPSGPCELTFTVPSTGTAARVQLRGPRASAAVRSILASVRELPEDQVAIPAPRHSSVRSGIQGYVDELAGLGLEGRVVRRTCPDNARCVTGILSIHPEPGSVVARGSSVEITHY